MRAFEATAPGGLDCLKLVERPDPVPAAGQVLVRIRAVSLNYRDGLVIKAQYGGRLKTPTVPFSDGCGVIEAVGAGVTRVKPGDRVATMFFERWIGGKFTAEARDSALGQGGNGAGAELILLSEDGVSKVPDYLSDHQVATLPCAALTAWRALFEDADMKPGQTVLLQGTGGVSIFGLQLAHAAGMETIILSSSDEKLDRARALGADHTINYRTTPEWAADVLALTGGRGVDFVMEVGGEKTFAQSQKAAATDGHIAIIGGVSGRREELDLYQMIAKNLRIQGVMVGSREMFERMCQAMSRARIQPVVDKIHPMTDARGAFETMAKGEHFGKIVIDFTA